MSRAAAFFDLDKTVLAKSSALALAKPLQESGLLARADVLRAAYHQLVYSISGADAEFMEQARTQMSRLIAGWPVDQVSSIVNDTLDSVITPLVYREALDLFDEHEAANRDVIIISSSGTEIVEPIGSRLGVFRAIGTQARIVDGKYTGELLLYAYGEEKARIINSLSSEFGYDLDDSWAYSDSITDLPMLEAVGNPVATNPDRNLRAIAEERDWPIMDFDKPVALRQQSVASRNRAAAGAAGAAVALGLAWYARQRRQH